MRRVALIGVVALLVIGFALWVANTSQRAGLRIAGDPAMPSEPESQSASRLEALETEARRSEATIASESSIETPASAVSTNVGRLTLHGTLVVLDEQGAEFRRESGSLELNSWAGGPMQKTAVEVKDGTFTAPIPAGVRFFPARGSFRDRVAQPLVRDALTVPSDGCLEIRMRWRASAMVHVRDARTGRHLPRIEIDARRVRERSSAPLPPSMHAMPIVTLRGDSPFVIPPYELDGMMQANVLFVRADGYAWSNARFDAQVGGEVFVELSPASGLDVDVSQTDSSTPVTITLTQEGKKDPFFMSQLRGTRMAVDDVPAGKYMLAAISIQEPSNTVLATQAVDLVEGTRTHVDLDLAAAERPKVLERAAMSGRLVVPIAWKAAAPRLTVRHLSESPDPMRWSPVSQLADPTRNGDFDTYAWEFKNLPVGKYIVSSSDPACSVAVELLVGGTSNVLLEAPAPADVSVRVVDAQSGQDVPVDQVRWQWMRDHSAPKSPSSRASRDGTTLTYNFRCPVGRVELSVAALELGFEPVTETAALAPGHNDVVLRMVRCVAMRVTLQDGTKPVLFDKGQKYEVSALDGDGRVVEWSRAANGPTVARISKPGGYRIALHEPLAGYLMPPEQIVDLKPGTMTDVVIRLTRKP